MNLYQTLKQAAENFIPVVAHVNLYNGEQRIRIGLVANVNSAQVTFYDLGKGFRTTPIQLVRKLELAPNHKQQFAPVIAMLKARGGY